MASAPGTIRFGEITVKPPAPPAGYALIYIKTDNVLYLEDSSGTEIALGSASVITALTGDGTATGPGSAVFTLATVNGNVGTFGSSTSIPTFTVNAKGLITAASGNAVVAPSGTLSGTTLNATVVDSSLTSVGTLVNLTVTNPITGSITGSSGSTTGNAATATALQTPRTINGVSFDGTANITVTAAAGTLTGTTLNSTVVSSSLTSVGTLVNLTVTNPISGNITGTASTFTGNLTGDITSVGMATTITNNIVTNTKLAQMPTNTIKGNNTGGTANALDLTVSQVNTMLGTVTSVSASSPLQSSGGATPTISFTNQSANLVLAGPTTGAAAAPTFRALVNADIPLPINVTKTANYTILSTDNIIFVDTSGGAFTLTLPSPTGLAGKLYRIVGTTGTMQANPVTLARSASEKIEGLAASKLLQTNWGFFQVVTNGVDWFVG